ncbi:MAG: hypothetical protein SXV54_25475 [Chloroflexota bacterium]|nr:hypothetical protein [Chloroflexota bacterium]
MIKGKEKKKRITSRFAFRKSLYALLVVGVLVGLGTIPVTSATPDAAPSAASDVLLFVEAEFDSPGLDGATSVAASLDGKHVYVVSNWEDAVAAFERDSAPGVLTFIEFEQDGVGDVNDLDGAQSIAIAPAGAVSTWRASKTTP